MIAMEITSLARGVPRGSATLNLTAEELHSLRLSRDARRSCGQALDAPGPRGSVSAEQ